MSQLNSVERYVKEQFLMLHTEHTTSHVAGERYITTTYKTSTLLEHPVDSAILDHSEDMTVTVLYIYV